MDDKSISILLRVLEAGQKISQGEGVGAPNNPEFAMQQSSQAILYRNAATQ